MKSGQYDVIRIWFIVLVVIFSSAPLMAAAEIVAQSGYRPGEDGLLLLSTPCPSDKTGQLRNAVKRLGSQVLEGCYVINNRGNVVVKWRDGSLVEVAASVFDVKSLPKRESAKSEAWLLGWGGKSKCSRLEGTVDEEFERVSERWAGHMEVLSPPHDSNGHRFFQVIATDPAGRQLPFTVTDSGQFCKAADDPKFGANASSARARP